MGKKRIVIIVLIVVFIFVTISVISMTGWRSPVLFPVTRIVREIIAPVQKGIMTLTNNADRFFAYFRDNKTASQENEELKKRITELEEKIYTLNEQELENQRLKELLHYKEEKAENYELLLAKVIARDPGNWNETVIIDRGSQQGIEQDMPVVTHDGLVGMVISVTNNTAEVLLIIDAEGAIGARILENRFAPGVVVGTDKSDYLQMIHLSHDAPVEVGQTVVSSGLGGIFPPGIRIGTVAQVAMEPGGLVKNAQIKPFVDFGRLEEAFVILQVKSPELELLSEEADTEKGVME